jgi:ribonuclease E
MRKALINDRARVQVGRISRFGLLELSRQRLRSSLTERWTQDVNTLSTSVLRLIEEETSKPNTSEVRAIVSPDMSSLLLNERRIRLNDIEARSNIKVVVISDATRPDSRFEVLRIKDGKVIDPDKSRSSVSTAEQFEKKSKTTSIKEKPAVKIMPSARPRKGIISKIVDILTKPKPKKSKIKSPPKNFKKDTNKLAPSKKNKTNAPKNVAKKDIQKDAKAPSKTVKKASPPKKSSNDKTKDAPVKVPKKLSRPKKDADQKENINTKGPKEAQDKNGNVDQKISKKSAPMKEPKKEISQTPTSSNEETVVPRKLSRPKKEIVKKVSEDSKKIPEKKEINTEVRASNDPRNKTT